MYYIYSNQSQALEHIARINDSLGYPKENDHFVGGGKHIVGYTETYGTPIKHPELDLWAIRKEDISQQFYTEGANEGEISDWNINFIEI